MIFLVICELAEAVEAERNGANIQSEEEGARVANECLIKGDKEGFYTVYQDFVRGGIAEELADACIRILDLAGYHKIKMQLATDYMRRHKHEGVFDLAEEMMVVVEMLESLYTFMRLQYHDFGKEHRVTSAFSYICWIAEELDIDLPLHIDLKLAYNAQRPRLHGKKY